MIRCVPEKVLDDLVERKIAGTELELLGPRVFEAIKHAAAQELMAQGVEIQYERGERHVNV